MHVWSVSRFIKAKISHRQVSASVCVHFCLFIVFRCDCNSKFASRSVWKHQKSVNIIIFYWTASPPNIALLLSFFSSWGWWTISTSSHTTQPEFHTRAWTTHGEDDNDSCYDNVLIDIAWHGLKWRYRRPLLTNKRTVFSLIKGMHFGLIQAFFLSSPL